MNLINILSATRTAPEDEISLTIVADLGGGPEEMPFAYSPHDPYGLSHEVTAWLMSNPEFPIEPYQEPLTDAPD